MDWNQIFGFILSGVGNALLTSGWNNGANQGGFGNSQNNVVNNPNTVLITNNDGRQLVIQETTWTPNNQGPWSQQSWGNNYQTQPLWGNTNNNTSWLSGGLGYNNNHTNCHIQPASYNSPQLGRAPIFGGNNWFNPQQLQVPTQIRVSYPFRNI